LGKDCDLTQIEVMDLRLVKLLIVLAFNIKPSLKVVF